MSWTTVVWSMEAAVCLMLAAVYLLSWCRRREETAHLLFAVSAADPQPVDVNASVNQVLNLLHGEIVARKAKVVLVLGEGLPPVKAGQVEVQQVLMNRVINSLDSIQSDPRHGRVEISSTCHDRSILEVVGRSAPAQQSDPLAIHLGDIPELLANQGVDFEVVMLFHQLAESLTLQGVVGCKRAELDVVEDLLLGHGWHAEAGIGHASVCPTGRKMYSDLFLNAGFQLFDRLEKSAVACAERNAILAFQNNKE